MSDDDQDVVFRNVGGDTLQTRVHHALEKGAEPEAIVQELQKRGMTLKIARDLVDNVAQLRKDAYRRKGLVNTWIGGFFIVAFLALLVISFFSLLIGGVAIFFTFSAFVAGTVQLSRGLSQLSAARKCKTL